MPLDPMLMTAAAVAAAVLIAGLGAGLFLLRRRARPASGPLATEARSPWVSGLAKTRGGLSRLVESWRGGGDAAGWLSEMEEVLLTSDVGVGATRALVERIRGRLPALESPAALRELLQGEVRAILENGATPAIEAKPTVVLVVGVNGVGKTTTIGKLAHRWVGEGKKVLLVAGDTFRAAAAEQLTVWAERAGADLVKHQQGADPAAVVFDGLKAAVARGVDVVIVDTAGRLHVKASLMEELRKIARTTGRLVPGAPHQVLLVIDATTGQNGLNQARVFHEAVPVTGVVLTKLDGTARGGVALAIRQDLGLPISYAGLGERAEDLAPFDAGRFAEALFGESSA